MNVTENFDEQIKWYLTPFIVSEERGSEGGSQEVALRAPHKRRSTTAA